ncbi:hypothetical protein FRC00_004350, partial [Tulasnella sp. 408]
MSDYRIDPIRIQTTDAEPGARGGQGVVISGTLLPKEDSKELPHPALEKLFPGGYRELLIEALVELLPEALEQSFPEAVKELLPRAYEKLVSEAIQKPQLERKVAVKKLEWPRDDAEKSTKFFKSFVNELSLMAPLSHPNIIEFLGFVEDMDKGRAWIILPWQANGNVRDFLRSSVWDIPERVSLIQDTAKGVEYLHTRVPPICHGDLKSLNILVNSSHRAVITDFGSSRIRRSVGSDNQSEMPCQIPLDDGVIAPGLTAPKVTFNRLTLDFTLTGPMGTLRWSAPEVMAGEVPNLPSDMWAIGWICWEIITGRLPFEELSREEAVISHTVTGRLPPIREEAQLSHVLMLCNLMSNCWAPQSTKRIDATMFERKLRMLTPSSSSPGSQKARSAGLLLQLGAMYDNQDDREKAEFYFMSALETATGKSGDAAEANGPGARNDENSDLQGAEVSSKQAQETLSRTGSSLGTAVSLGDLREIDRLQSESGTASKSFSHTHKTHFRISDDLDAANAFLGLGNTYRAQSKNLDAEKAFNAAHEIHSRIGNNNGTATSLLGLGNTYRAQSKYQEAENAFKAAHETHSRIGSDLGAANALLGLGNIYRAQSKNNEAENAFNGAHEIHSRIGSDFGAAHALNGLGETYCAQSKYKEAEKAFKTAQEIHSNIGNDLGVANTLRGLGDIYRAQSKNREAEEAFNAAHKIHSRIGNEMGVANALLGLGNIYIVQSKNQEAEKVFNTAHEIYSRIGNEAGAASALDSLGSTYRAQSKNKEAEKAFNTAREIHTRIGDDMGAANSLDGLGETYRLQSKNKKAEKAFDAA